MKIKWQKKGIIMADARGRLRGRQARSRPKAVKSGRISEQLEAGLIQKYERLKEEIKSAEGALVAFSGGIDSSLLLRVATDVLGKRATAVIVDSPLFSRQEIQAARRLAADLKVNLKTVQINSLEIPGVAKNTDKRCYYCKFSLFSRLKELAREMGLNRVLEGSNLDDSADFRPGRKALKELGIYSPLAEAGFTKAEIRRLARYLGLPNWNKPQAACLASRIPYGQPLDRVILEKIEKGEEIIRQLGFSQVRLRHHGEIARIEIDPKEFLLWFKPGISEKVVADLKKLGYRYITLDLDGYRAGSLNPPHN